jgi:hypothetical protein
LIVYLNIDFKRENGTVRSSRKSLFTKTTIKLEKPIGTTDFGMLEPDKTQQT